MRKNNVCSFGKHHARIMFIVCIVYLLIITCTFDHQPNGTWKKGYSKSEMNGNVTSLELLNGSLDTSLANSPLTLNQEVRNKVLRPKSLVEKARMNVA